MESTNTVVDKTKAIYDHEKVMRELKDQSDSLEAKYKAFQDGFKELGALLAERLSLAFSGPFKQAD